MCIFCKLCFQDLKWSGLQAGNLFDRPKAVMMFSVDSVPRSMYHFLNNVSFNILMLLLGSHGNVIVKVFIKKKV